MLKSDFVRADGMVPVEDRDGNIFWEPYQPGRLPDGSIVNPWDDYVVNPNDPINPSLAMPRDLPPSGVISMGDIRTEVSGAGQCSLNDADFRGLIGKSSGQQQAMSEYYNKSASQPGEGEIGTGGSCFSAPATGGTRPWGKNEAYSKDGYCGWYNKIEERTGWHSSSATWQLGWDSVRDRTQNVRISYRSMCSTSPRQTNNDVSQQNTLLCGETESAQNYGYWFHPQIGASTSRQDNNMGAFIIGAITTHPSNPSWGEIGIQWAMMNDGAVGYSWDGDFVNDYYGCSLEFSFVNKAGVNKSPSGLPNGGKDPYPLTFRHNSNWGNYAGAVHRTLYIRMENV